VRMGNTSIPFILERHPNPLFKQQTKVGQNHI
jgi:hypothetical protein